MVPQEWVQCQEEQGCDEKRSRVVERRAAGLPGEYRRPLGILDQKYHDTPAGQVGPLQRRLEGFVRLQCWGLSRRIVKTSTTSWNAW